MTENLSQSNTQQSQSQKNQTEDLFQLVDDLIIQLIYTHMLQQERYHDIWSLLRLNKRFRIACQGLFNDEKQRLINLPPSVINQIGGTQEWHDSKDQWHRGCDLPAIINEKFKTWYKHGQIHRDGDQPAVEYASGTRMWYINGQRHRDGGFPAIEHANGGCEWWVHGQPHREGGLPAIDLANGTKRWYINGIKQRS